MRAKGNAIVGLLLAATVAAGCTQGRDDSAFNTLASRLDQLEMRIAATDTRAELAVLEQRLASIEARLAVEVRGAEGSAAAPPAANVNAPVDPASAAGSPSGRADTLPERNQRVRSIADEDRARVARIQEQFRDNPDPAALRRPRRKPQPRITVETAAVFGSLAAHLKKAGRAADFRINDVWSAAQAIHRDCRLLTFNPKDFEGIPRLKVVAMPLP